MSKEPYDKCNNTILNYKKKKGQEPWEQWQVCAIIIIFIIIRIQHQIYTVGKRSCQRCPSKKLDMQELIMGLRPRGSVSQLQCL